MREACKFNVQIHNGNILMSSVTKDPGVSSILLFNGSGMIFPRPLYVASVHTSPLRREGSTLTAQRRYDMNVRFEMQGGKNWIFPKEMIANRFFRNSHWLEIWSNHFCPSMGPNGGIVAMASDRRGRRGGSAGRGGRGWLKGEKLEVEDVAGGTEKAKAA
jgi:hypothetical protein